MNIAEYIVQRLKNDGIDKVFGYAGGNITYVLDAISRSGGIDYIQTYNEQGAAFACNAYAQISEKYGVAVSSSGPGAINMINGIANAYYDSIPCLFITGNVNSSTMRGKTPIRQRGFQETNIVGLVEEITKFSVTVSRDDDIDEVFDMALNQMTSGRPGPVLIDLPHDVQRMEYVYRKKKKVAEAKDSENVSEEEIIRFKNSLKKSSYPIIIVGGGCRSSLAKQMVSEFAEQNKIPVVSSLLGKDVVDNYSNVYCGMIGSYGHNAANDALKEADFAILLGTRVDERQRTVTSEEFLADAEVFRADVDGGELGHTLVDKNNINSTVEEFLEKIFKYACKERFTNWCKKCRLQYEGEMEDRQDFLFAPKWGKILEEAVGDCTDKIICADVGNNQMFVAQRLQLGKNSSLLNSGGLGSMGYSIPAAIGAFFADRSREVVCIAGDGGIMMNLQELQVIARDNLPIKIIVVNNKSLGMIEAYQKVAFKERYVGSKEGYLAPNFREISKAFGIEYHRFDEGYELSKTPRAVLIEMEIDDE